MPENKYRLFKQEGSGTSNYSVVKDYDNLHKAISEAKQKNQRAAENRENIYFMIATPNWDVIAPD